MNGTDHVSDLGPIRVLYDWADQMLRGTQGVILSPNVVDFVDSVRWNEPFIRALILAQVMLFGFTYLTRRVDLIQFGILLLLTAITLSAERLNQYGSKNWKRFASQDYFDAPGLFMMIFVSGPFVLLANFIVIGMALRLVKLYAKRARAQARARQQESEKKDS